MKVVVVGVAVVTFLYRGAGRQDVRRAARCGSALGLEAAGGLARVPGAEFAPSDGRVLAGPPA